MADSDSVRTQRGKDKKKDAGLDPMYLDVHPDDKPAIRKYADSRPKTKAIKDKMRAER